MKDKPTLLLDRLLRRNPHVRPHDRLADRFALVQLFFCRLTFGLT